MGGGGFTLLSPTPGTAGVVNSFDFTGATSSGEVFIYAGTAPGTTNVSVPGCGTVTMDFGGTLRRIVRGPADSMGNGPLNRFIPGGAAGLSVELQAVDQGTCSKSNVVSHTF